MDPFQVRMQFLGLLRRLNASQQSIQKVVSYAIKFYPPCGEDLWDCFVEEIQKGSINSRLNLMYFLDSLCESCMQSKTGPDAKDLYIEYVPRDLVKIVENVTPAGREGLPNLTSTKQILENWRAKGIVDAEVVDSVISSLSSRNPPPEPSPSKEGEPSSTTKERHHHHHRHQHHSKLGHQEIFRRIEEDRERHKRLRERRWVQPVSHQNLGVPHQLFSFMPDDVDLTIDVEFEKDWETVSDWNEDDDEACREENELCFINESSNVPVPMDLSS